MWSVRKLVGLLLVLASSAFGLTAGSAHHTRHKKKPHKATWFEYRVFVPSHENLLSQNTMIDQLGLPRLKDDKGLKSEIAESELVPITENQYVRVCYKLDKKRRYVKPWVDPFLQELGQAYYEKFGEAIQVNSAVRTEKVQWSLLRWNHNAAPVHGETASAHLAGVAVDLQRRGLSPAQVHFIQKFLLNLARFKEVIVEEELKQPCFHVVVTGEYPFPPPMPHIEPKMPDLFLETPNGNSTVDNPTAHP